MKIQFSKYEACGNDFILIDNRKKSIALSVEHISYLCNRHFGIGADGLLFLENEQDFDFRMRYFNSDGSIATFCGNGGRSIVWFAKLSGVQKSSFTFIADDGSHEAVILSSDENEAIIELKMSNAILYDTYVDGCFLNTGTPHVVKFVNNIDTFDVYNEGKQIRNSSRYQPEGVNVNFVEQQGLQLKVRTYEKGVENETLSCGTGAVASAIAASQHTDTDKFDIITKGGNLKVKFNNNNNQYTDIKLIGAARFVFSGEIFFKK